MHDYWVEFGKVALAHLLAVASPGPDFAIVVKQSLAHGRRTAVWNADKVPAGIYVCRTTVNGREGWAGKIIIGK